MFIFDDEKLLNRDFPKIDRYKKQTINKRKQVILREFNIFDLLIKILDKLKSDKFILNKKKNLEDN